MHSAQDEQDDPDFAAQHFKDAAQIMRRVWFRQSESDKADVDEIKTENEQMIDRIGERFIAVECIDEKNTPVFVQRVRGPNGQANADDEINEIGPNDEIHDFLLSGFTSKT